MVGDIMCHNICIFLLKYGSLTFLLLKSVQKSHTNNTPCALRTGSSVNVMFEYKFIVYLPTKYLLGIIFQAIPYMFKFGTRVRQTQVQLKTMTTARGAEEVQGEKI